MQHDVRDTSPVVERPLYTAREMHRKQTCSVSGSTLPAYDLDPTTRQLLEENEDMLYRINVLTRELEAAKDEVQVLKTTVAEKNKELDTMREKLEGANMTAWDASGRVINYKAECERLNAENKTLTENYQKVCSELEQRTEGIRQDMERLRVDSARKSMTQSVEQFCSEVLSVFSSVYLIVTTLERCAVDVANRERALENVQKEFSTLRRYTDSVRRIRVDENGRVNDVLSAACKKERIQSPGDALILIRWMVAEGLLSGMRAVEKNLQSLASLLASGGKATGGIEENVASSLATGTVGRLFKRPPK
ncbi:hypothetical protein TraAM80_09756 [Trypanosoma rangeli]|uniref:Uncharacterized protein n=1 Tax=Trypanosoma rangeli TaxID=5698 RepID=A0A422MTH2_TRYRA|nr:uncharacterized protein TraAM80_09756 [Trypanosoma rangeli]RNE96504.1 hypothetical protein TraAM80_09756 [Trypanosoma rangeli]|eukprot:RNE96504.1 hypothetical protein TraAM80_09756 [Trypanosoma rangeli]